MIIFKENIIDSATCDSIIHFFENHSELHELTDKYSSTNHVICKKITIYPDNTNLERTSIHTTIYNIIDIILREHVVNHIQEKMPYIENNISQSFHFNPFPNKIMSTSYEIRKITQSTNLHIDEVQPMKITSDTISIRIGSILLSLSESEDTIYFPLQNIEYKLSKGALLFFPPYWCYPHYTEKKDTLPRYAIQLWLCVPTAI